VQARGSAEVGSPIYAELLTRAAADLERGGPFAALVGDYPGHPVLDALPLRALGAAHRLVLAGRAPALAVFYPSVGGRFEADGAWQALLGVVETHRAEIRDALSTQVQTNEVQRSAVLLPGFLRVARATGLPLRLREVGSSAGLNLLWDRFGYELGPHRWGDPVAPLVLAADWSGPAPDLDAPVSVASRAGCDLAPIDARDPDQCLRLESFVWPDQLDRLERLRAALSVARETPPPIVRARAGEWVPAELAWLPRGQATVLFHSVIWWYLPKDERDRMTLDVQAAGARASTDAPLAWLRMEGAITSEAELRLTLWPGGEDRLLARVHWHGRFVRFEG
jgi:hypothetical protein